jgi:hypothetical protein
MVRMYSWFLYSELTLGSLIIWINSEGTDYFFVAGSRRPLHVPSGFRSFNLHGLQPCKAVRRAPDHTLGYAYNAGRFRFRLRFRESELEWGNQSGKPFDSDCLHRLAGACHHYTHLHCETKDILCADWRRLSESESEPESSCTADWRRLSESESEPESACTADWRRLSESESEPESACTADWRRLSESESEPESACTIRCAPTGADSRNRSRNLNLPALYAYRYTGLWHFPWLVLLSVFFCYRCLLFPNFPSRGTTKFARSSKVLRWITPVCRTCNV